MPFALQGAGHHENLLGRRHSYLPGLGLWGERVQLCEECVVGQVKATGGQVGQRIMGSRDVGETRHMSVSTLVEGRLS